MPKPACCQLVDLSEMENRTGDVPTDNSPRVPITPTMRPVYHIPFSAACNAAECCPTNPSRRETSRPMGKPVCSSKQTQALAVSLLLGLVGTASAALQLLKRN